MRLLGYLALLTGALLISACRPTKSGGPGTAPSPSSASSGDDGRVPARDPLVGKWGFPGRPDYWELGADGSLRQYQEVNFPSGRRVYVTTTGTWQRVGGHTLRLKIRTIDPPDLQGGDADVELVSVSDTELRVRNPAGQVHALVRQ